MPVRSLFVAARIDAPTIMHPQLHEKAVGTRKFLRPRITASITRSSLSTTAIRFSFSFSFVCLLSHPAQLARIARKRKRARAICRGKNQSGIMAIAKSYFYARAPRIQRDTALHNPKVSTLLRATRRFYAPADSPGVPQHHFSPMDPSRAIDICIGLARRIDST